MAKTSFKTTVVWQTINWQKLERRVYKLQNRIYQAARRGDVKTYRKLQKLLLKSWYAKVLAIRRISQDNKGKKTAGVDGIKSLNPKQRMTLAENLHMDYKAKPLRRVWIPKPGRKEKRPLGIPTMYDRALQTVAKMALEPEWEAKFEPNSYGFRMGRSCHDAIEAIFNTISQKPKYVLDADIAQCFDKINHKALLNKINTFPQLRRQIRAWLKAGTIDAQGFSETVEGTPQGGTISPLLANIALHGIEERVKQYAETLDMRYGNGNLMSKRDRRYSLSLIRYADDFVVLHKDKEVIHKCQGIISDWLKEIGLRIKPEKTRIAHTLEEYQRNEPGFDFLGFNVKQYKVGKTHSKQGYKTLITPSKKSINSHLEEITDVIRSCKARTQDELICRLNPKIKGWSNYYSTVTSKETFNKMDCIIFLKLKAWATRRHNSKGKKWVMKKYWKSVGSRSWVFKDDKELFNYSDKPIVRYIKVKVDASPYDGNLVYWSNRTGKNPILPTRVAKLLKKQKGICPLCGMKFLEHDVLEVDHISPKSKGGKDEYKNLQLLHRHCHHKKTSTDGSQAVRKTSA